MAIIVSCAVARARWHRTCIAHQVSHRTYRGVAIVGLDGVAGAAAAAEGGGAAAAELALAELKALTTGDTTTSTRTDSPTGTSPAVPRDTCHQAEWAGLGAG